MTATDDIRVGDRVQRERERAVIAAAREWWEADRDVPGGIMRPRWMEMAERERAARGVLYEALAALDGAPDGAKEEMP